MSGIGHNSIGGPAAEQFKQIVARIERLEEEQKALADDKKEVYAEAKGLGYDVKVLRKLIQRRKTDKDLLAEQDAILDLYEGVFA